MATTVGGGGSLIGPSSSGPLLTTASTYRDFQTVLAEISALPECLPYANFIRVTLHLAGGIPISEGQAAAYAHEVAAGITAFQQHTVQALLFQLQG